MIGQRASATVWMVVWRHLKPEDPSASPVSGRSAVMTADPTGADVLDVAQLVILGAKATPAHQFSILEMTRASEVDGLALLPPNDRGWPAPIEPGAALLQAAMRHGRRLWIEREHVRRLEEENAALWRVAQLVEREHFFAELVTQDLDDAKAARERRLEVTALAEQSELREGASNA